MSDEIIGRPTQCLECGAWTVPGPPHDCERNVDHAAEVMIDHLQGVARLCWALRTFCLWRLAAEIRQQGPDKPSRERW